MGGGEGGGGCLVDILFLLVIKMMTEGYKIKLN